MIQTNQELLNAVFTEERQPGDIDLINCVRSILIKSGLRQQVEQLFDTDVSILAAKDKRPMVQRQAIVEFWNLQFMGTPTFGHEERACLNLPFTDEEWLRVFMEKLVPFIIDNKLPKALY